MPFKVKSYEVVIEMRIEVNFYTLHDIVEANTDRTRASPLDKITAIKELRDAYRTDTGHTISLRDAKDLIELTYAQIQND